MEPSALSTRASGNSDVIHCRIRLCMKFKAAPLRGATGALVPGSALGRLPGTGAPHRAASAIRSWSLPNGRNESGRVARTDLRLNAVSRPRAGLK